ncbi:type VII secretion protein EccB [Streptomyces sp. NPDC047072]|uniref:type VII secretion protein EccB n=1 Tax=Streptomyces sp. NPDC047072 TaxID=3154809 RepID=UPI0033F08172
MQSKRDQVQAHAFVMNRLTSGMLLADPDAPESPLGRTTRGAVTGIVVAVLVAAGAVVYGLISPGGDDSWRTSGTLVVNRETGARYLYYDGRLRPVRNYASARLIGGKDLKAEDVSTASLGDTPVGAAVGIPGAPDALPGSLDSGAWQVCSALDEDGGAVTALIAGGPTAAEGIGPGDGVVVKGPDSAVYLVWQGSRLRLDEKSGAAVSLGYGTVTPRPVSAAFLDALVEGPDLTSPDVPDLGATGPALGSGASKVGQVFRVSVPGSTERPYYQLGKEGLVPLTATGAALALGDPAIREKAYGGASPTAADLGADTLKQHLAPGAEGRSPGTDGLPATPPRATAVPERQAACARVEPAANGTRVASALVPVTDLGPVTAAPTDQVRPACLRVDGVVVRPGHGALVRALGADGTVVGDTTYLVADNGVKYRVPSKTALEALGHSDATVRPLPAPLLSMLPTGPDLDPSAASGANPPRTTGPACNSPVLSEN